MKKKFFTLLVAILAVGTQLSFAQGPAVTAELIEATTTTISVKITPNAATGTYHVADAKTGEMERRFESFADMFEWGSFSDMIKSQGQPFTGEQNYLIEKVTPSTKRELWIQPLDADGKYGELQHFTFSTVPQGGEGVAKVAVELGEYYADDKDQLISFAPNDQTNYYLSFLFMDSDIDYFGGTIEGAIQYLIDMDAEEENHPDMASYEAATVHFVETDAVPQTLITIARNAKDEWGPADVKKFVPGTPAKIDVVKANTANDKMYSLQGQKVNAPRGIVIKGGKKYIIK